MPTYVNLGDVCRSKLGMQCQYGVRYAFMEWANDYQFCGDGLRIVGKCDAYHDVEIHKDDIDTFVGRVELARSNS